MYETWGDFKAAMLVHLKWYLDYPGDFVGFWDSKKRSKRLGKTHVKSLATLLIAPPGYHMIAGQPDHPNEHPPPQKQGFNKFNSRPY